jgi:hypothetical protein
LKTVIFQPLNPLLIVGKRFISNKFAPQNLLSVCILEHDNAEVPTPNKSCSSARQPVSQTILLAPTEPFSNIAEHCSRWFYSARIIEQVSVYQRCNRAAMPEYLPDSYQQNACYRLCKNSAVIYRDVRFLRLILSRNKSILLIIFIK